MEKKLLERFTKKNCKRQIKQFRVEKVINNKSIGYKNYFNNWIDIKDIAI